MGHSSRASIRSSVRSFFFLRAMKKEERARLGRDRVSSSFVHFFLFVLLLLLKEKKKIFVSLSRTFTTT